MEQVLQAQGFVFCSFPPSYLEHIYDADDGVAIWDNEEISKRLKAMS